MTAKPKHTEASMLALLRSHHGGGDGDSCAFLTHVASGTGHAARRFCDALAMDLWPSKGLGLTGYEVKVSRGDWQREMQDIHKSEAFSRFCDYWFVAAPDGVVELSELPANWGLICPSGSGMKVRRPATKVTPEPYTRHFIAALLRYAVRQSPVTAEIDRIKKQAKEEAEKALEWRIENARQRAANDFSNLQKTVQQFEEAAGFSIASGWPYGVNAGKCVNLMLRAGWRESIEGLSGEANRLREAAKIVDEIAIALANKSKEGA